MEEIINLREKIDELDHELVEIIKKRLNLSREIGKLKMQNGFKIIDKKREKEILKDKLEKSSLDAKFVKKLFKLIIHESRKVQNSE